jgi:hypothetical protein
LGHFCGQARQRVARLIGKTASWETAQIVEEVPLSLVVVDACLACGTAVQRAF